MILCGLTWAVCYVNSTVVVTWALFSPDDLFLFALIEGF